MTDVVPVGDAPPADAEPATPDLTPVERFRALAPTAAELQGRRAGVVTRSMAYVVDFAIVLAAYPLMAWGVGIIVGIFTFDQPQYPDWPGGVQLVVTLGWNFVYFVGCWYMSGRTVGMGVFGIRVLGLRPERRKRLHLVQCVVRFAVMFTTLAVEPVWIAFSKSRLGLHDRFARTQVVYSSGGKRTSLRMDLAVGANDPVGAQDRVG